MGLRSRSVGSVPPERPDLNGTRPAARAAAGSGNGQVSQPATAVGSNPPLGARSAMTALLTAVWCYRRVDALLAWTGAEFGEPGAGAGDGDAAEPDATVGPILPRAQAPGLFTLLANVARRTGGVFPTEVRVAYLPACGVLDLGDDNGYPRRVLIIGLPCLQIWSVDELGAVLAHEVAHWRNQDARFAREVVQFGMTLRCRAVAPGRGLHRMRPRWLLARWMGAGLVWLARPISRAMEFRADQLAAECFGGTVLAGALEKLAIVQPLFRELLRLHDPLTYSGDNVYERFELAWQRLCRERYAQWRDRIVGGNGAPDRWDPHPPIGERLARLRLDGAAGPAVNGSPNALGLVDDAAALRTVLHNRLYGAYAQPASVFQRTSS